MRTIVIGGFSSGVGKTSVVCRLLEVLPGWGALKTSPHHGESGFEIVQREKTLRMPGSDTSRYLKANASRVAWLRYRPGQLEEGLRAALLLFEGTCPGVVVEGNSAASHLPASLVILVGRMGRVELKESAKELLARADYLVMNREPGSDAWPPATFSDAEKARWASFDVEDHGDEEAEKLLDRVLTWTRRPA